MEEDFYCSQILTRKIPFIIELETPHTLAFHHTRPSYPIHIVVIPKTHITSVTQIRNMKLDQLFDMMNTVSEVASRIESIYASCRIITNLGEYQETKHLHWHIISGDKLERQ